LARSTLWLVDAYNVLRVSLAPVSPAAGPGAAPEGSAEPQWWSEARREHLASLAARLAAPNAEICLVFDARHLLQAHESPQAHSPQAYSPQAYSPQAQESEADEQLAHETDGKRIRIVFAPSADEWIVATVKEIQKTKRETRVVTADRVLANRVRSRGATIVPTDEFVALCQRAPRRRTQDS
jgi:predicted RNA-binding protein with PIN domain